MRICALPHAAWNPSLPRTNSKPSLAELFGESSTSGDPLDLPFTLPEAHHIFVAQAYDLFAESDAFVQQVFRVMSQAGQHEFQIQTAHGDRLKELGPGLPWRSNIWMGVEIARPADKVRLDHLRASGATVRFADVVAPVALDARDLDRIDFVLTKSTGALEHAGVLAACKAVGCRLFAGPVVDALEVETGHRTSLAQSPFEAEVARLRRAERAGSR